MSTPQPNVAPTPRRLGAAGALVYVAAFVASILLAGPPLVHPGQAGVEHSLSGRGITLAFASMSVLLLGLLALVVAMTFLAQSLGRGGAVAALTAQSAWAGGIAVVSILAVALGAGAAALWAQGQGSDLSTVLAINNVRNFAYFAVMPFMGLAALGFGAAAVASQSGTRWIGWGGIVVGVLALLGIPAAAVGISFVMPLWLLWWLGVGISLLRPTRVTEHVQDPARAMAVVHD